MLAALTDAVALWVLGVVKASERRGKNTPWESHPPTAHHPGRTCTRPGGIVGSERRYGDAETRTLNA